MVCIHSTSKCVFVGVYAYVSVKEAPRTSFTPYPSSCMMSHSKMFMKLAPAGVSYDIICIHIHSSCIHTYPVMPLQVL